MKMQKLSAALAVCLMGSAASFPAQAQTKTMPIPVHQMSVATSSADASYQVAHLEEQVAVLSARIQGLQIKYAPGTAYNAELSGVIPTGG